jgi:thiamine kinase-like enzyme
MAEWMGDEIVPWILSVDRPTNDAKVQSSGATEVLWSYLNSETSLAKRIASLRNDWSNETFIHGDARLENVLTDSQRCKADLRRTFIVDWELAALGEAAWDIACVFASMLELWVRSIRNNIDKDTATKRPSATIPLEPIKSALNDIWQVYASERRMEAREAVAFGIRCTELTAARLVQHALETTQSALQPPPSAYRLLQVAKNILDDPIVAAFQFLGVSWIER